jgi:hypothetical protein
MQIEQRDKQQVWMAAILAMVAASTMHAADLPTAGRFEFPTVGTGSTGRAVLLGIDDHLLPLRKNVCLYLTKPTVRAEGVVTPNRDDENAVDHLGAHFYGTVLRDDGKFRMWYYGISAGDETGSYRQGPVCYAESDDGLQWTKPNLMQLKFKESKANNAILLPDDGMQCAAVIRDETDRDPARRYKMIYTASEPNVSWTFRPATSADGLRWTVMDFPVRRFLEMGCFLKHNGTYIVHGQGFGLSEGGHAQGRTGYAAVSPDFDRWNAGFVEAFALPEPVDVKARGLDGDYDQVHLGVGATSFGNVAVGVYGLWHNPTAEQRNKKGWYGTGIISCDLGLVISHDGIHFREPVKGHVLVASEESAAPEMDGERWPTILCQANGIVNVGDETRIYHGRWRNGPLAGKGYYAEVAVATIGRDRWGGLALDPKVKEGEIWTAPVRLPTGGCGVALNADGREGIRVDVANENFSLIEKFSAESGATVAADGALEGTVTWATKDLSTLGGKTVRFRIQMQREGDVDPRVYAMVLNAGPPKN